MLLHAFVQQTSAWNPVFAGIRLFFVQTSSGHSRVPGSGLDKSHVSFYHLSYVLSPGKIIFMDIACNRLSDDPHVSFGTGTMLLAEFDCRGSIQLACQSGALLDKTHVSIVRDSHKNRGSQSSI